MDKSKCTREFKCADGNTYMCRPKSCFFCKHCTDIFYDWTHGPYKFICDIKEDIDNKGLAGECNEFIEDE